MSAPDTRSAATFAPSEAAERTGLTLDTLRYYEREGLIGPVDRTVSGRRRYTEGDLAWVGLVTCLRDAGLGIADCPASPPFTRVVPLIDRAAASSSPSSDVSEFTRLEVLDDKIAYYSR